MSRRFLEKIIPSKKEIYIYKGISLFLLPVISGGILSNISSTVTMLLFGEIVGVKYLAIISLLFTLTIFISSFFWGLLGGGMVLIGQAHGAKDSKGIRSIAGSTISIFFILNIFIYFLGAFFSKYMLIGIGTPLSIFSDALIFSRTTFFLMPISAMFFCYMILLRGIGISGISFISLLLSTAIQIVLTPAFIYGWAGLPQLGITSGAYASAIGFLGALLLLFIYLERSANPLALNRAFVPYLKIRGGVLKLLVQIGLPAGVQGVLLSLSEIALLSMVNRFGSGAIAAYGIVNQIVSYVGLPAFHISVAASVFGAHAIGGRDSERLSDITMAALRMTWIVGGFLVIIVYFFSNGIIHLFIADESTAHVARHLLSITLWSYLIWGTAGTLSGVMRASGAVIWPTMIGVFSIWGIEVPTAYFLSSHMGLDGIWISYPVSFSVSLVMQTTYFLVFWRKRIYLRFSGQNLSSTAAQ